MKKPCDKKKGRIVSDYCRRCGLLQCCDVKDASVKDCISHYEYPKDTDEEA